MYFLWRHFKSGSCETSLICKNAIFFFVCELQIQHPYFLCIFWFWVNDGTVVLNGSEARKHKQGLHIFVFMEDYADHDAFNIFTLKTTWSETCMKKCVGYLCWPPLVTSLALTSVLSELLTQNKHSDWWPPYFFNIGFH